MEGLKYLKKIFAVITIIAAVILSFSSCGKSNFEAKRSKLFNIVAEKSTSINTTDINRSNATKSTTINSSKDAESSAAKSSELSTERSVTDTKSNDVTSYVVKRNSLELEGQRSRLSKREKELYDEYVTKILAVKTFVIDFDKVDYESDTFDKVIDAIFGDYPQTMLYMRCKEKCDWYDDEGNPHRVLSKGVIYEHLWLSMCPRVDKEVLQNYIEEINSACDEIIEEMPAGLSTKSKYEWLGRKICEITVFKDTDDILNDPTIPDSEKEISVLYANGPLLLGKGICQSYSYAYQWLCHRAGLWCVTCSGGCHCWNVIKLDNGLTYHVDLTWADNSGDFERYFCLTQSEIEIDHSLYDGEWIADGV